MHESRETLIFNRSSTNLNDRRKHLKINWHLTLYIAWYKLLDIWWNDKKRRKMSKINKMIRNKLFFLHIKCLVSLLTSLSFGLWIVAHWQLYCILGYFSVINKNWKVFRVSNCVLLIDSRFCDMSNLFNINTYCVCTKLG